MPSSPIIPVLLYEDEGIFLMVDYILLLTTINNLSIRDL